MAGWLAESCLAFPLRPWECPWAPEFRKLYEYNEVETDLWCSFWRDYIS